jgi:alpha-ketoglutarate-dependent taurine dioxygenase
LVRGAGCGYSAPRLMEDQLFSGPLPRVIRAPEPGLRLAQWAAERKGELDQTLLAAGAILFRGFAVDSVDAFKQAADVFITDYMDYSFALTPRDRLTDAVATASLFPPDEVVPLHGEMDAHPQWPRRIVFYCGLAPAITRPGSSGETPIADARKIHDRLPAALRERFGRLGIKYVRNVRGAEALKAVFGTTDRGAISAYCQEKGYAVTFDADGARTEHVSHAIVSHPVTGEKVWFNHAQIYHLSSFPPEFVRAHHGVAPGAPLPLEAYDGSGAPIEREVMRQIRRAYQAEMVTFFWQQGDVLLLDNMLVAHGRRPFTGPRQVLVTMGDPYGAGAAAT